MEDERAKEWSLEQAKVMNEGSQIVRRASEEALDYVIDALENIEDQAWRKMSIQTQAVEIGVGTALVDIVVPTIYKDVDKILRKQSKLNKEQRQAVQFIFIGRVIKNIRKELNGREQL